MTTSTASHTAASALPSAASLKRSEPELYLSPAEEQALVEHDWISQADLDWLRSEANATGRTVAQLLLEKRVYTAAQIEACLAVNAWWKRSTAEHIDLITSEEAISAYQHDFSRDGYFTVPHFLPREQLEALDLALHRIALEHVDANPAKHKLYHSIGGQLLFNHQAFVDLIGHPALVKIAQAFIGSNLIPGKPYVKVENPYRYAGMFGHTHAETHYRTLSRTLYMFLYMDATTHDCGAFQVIPGSHRWYAEGDDGYTTYRGQKLHAQSKLTNKASLVHDPQQAFRWAGYESLETQGNTLVVLSPFLWHAVRPVMHRRRLIFLGFFDADALTREFIVQSDYFGQFPYDLRECDLSLLSDRQRDMMSIHLDREAWMQQHGL